MKVKSGFNIFLNYTLRVLFLLTFVGSVIFLFVTKPKITLLSEAFIILTILLIGFTYFYLKKDYNKKLLFTLFIFLGLILRILWFLNIDSIPVGDFNRMFLSSGEFLNGATYMFKGTAYFGRFPHMTMTVLYFSLIRKLFANPLIVIRILNIVFSMANIILLYFISKEIFKDEKKSIWTLLLASIYPPMILYNNVYCSENLAIPLLLTSVLLFLKAIKKQKPSVLLLLSGLFLSFSHLFRPIGYVVILAYILFLFIYFKEPILNKFKKSLLVLSTFLIPFILISSLLIHMNITEHPLWHGTEPPSVSILKGTNLKTRGMWNESDAKIFEKYKGNYEEVDKASKEIIKERLTQTPKLQLAAFYVLKFSGQWSNGSFAGDYWSERGIYHAFNKDYYLNFMHKTSFKEVIPVSKDLGFYIQLFYIVLMLLTYIGLYKSETKNNNLISFIYILFGGMALELLLIEFQDRYSYPFAWIFILLALTAFNSIPRKKKVHEV